MSILRAVERFYADVTAKMGKLEDKKRRIQYKQDENCENGLQIINSC